MTEQVSTADVAKYLEALNANSEGEVEKILVRRAGPTLYACQIWMRGDRDPDAYFLSLADPSEAGES